MRQLTSLDTQFLAMETPRQYGHVSGLAVYDPSTAPGGQVTVKDVCRLVGERLHLLPPFHWRLVSVPFDLDHPYWVDDPDFDLDFHIRETAVAPPGDPHKLAELVARIVARPLDRSRPLWELYLVHGLEHGHVAMLTKIHHAVVDGVSGAEVLSTLLDPSPEGRELPPKPGRRPDRVPGQLEMLARGLLGAPRQPVRALQALPSTVAGLPALPGLGSIPGAGTAARLLSRATRVVTGGQDGELLDRPPARAPRTLFNGRVSAHRRFAFGSLSLDKVKAIKNELGITVNDVVVGLSATAVRDWLRARDELPDEPLVAMVPVSTRGEEERGSFGNRVSAMFVPIPTDEPDTRARLMRTHDLLRGAKERHHAVPAELLQDATRFIPSALAARASRVTLQLGSIGPVRPPLNLVISNVPGPRMPMFCAGARLEAHYPVSVVVDGVGLNITVLSYRDHLDFGIVADRDQIDDAWPLLDGLRVALDEIDREICGARPPRGRPRRAPAQAS
jgi:diacylglycerol O-acyltransferase